MPKLPCKVPNKARSTAHLAERFPSLQKWKTPWEKIVDLPSLRANADKLLSFAELYEQRSVVKPDEHPDDKHVRFDGDALVAAADALSLTDKARRQLTEDSQLIAAWYLQPARQSHVGLTRPDDLRAVEQIAGWAQLLHFTIFTHLDGIEQLRDIMAVDDDGSFEDLDLVQCAAIIGSVAIFADHVSKQFKAPHGGRKPEFRRNYALALIVAAIEEATGKKVTSTRGPDSDPQKRFTDAAGQYVAEFFRSVGLKDEQVLVGAFEQISRTSRSSGD